MTRVLGFILVAVVVLALLWGLATTEPLDEQLTRTSPDIMETRRG